MIMEKQIGVQKATTSGTYAEVEIPMPTQRSKTEVISIHRIEIEGINLVGDGKYCYVQLTKASQTDIIHLDNPDCIWRLSHIHNLTTSGRETKTLIWADNRYPPLIIPYYKIFMGFKQDTGSLTFYVKLSYTIQRANYYDIMEQIVER